MFEDEPGECYGEGADVIERNDNKVTVFGVRVRWRLELELRTCYHMETLLWSWSCAAASIVMILIIIVIIRNIERSIIILIIIV